MSGGRFRLAAGKRDLWSPHVLTRSALRAWWAADDWTIAALATDDGSGVLSSWKDRINLINVTAATTARPTAAATSWIGTDGIARAGVTADGVANAMTLASVPSTLPTGANPGWIACVANLTSATAGNYYPFGYGVSANGRIIRTAVASPPSGSISTFALVGDGMTISDSRSAFGQHIVIGIYTGTTFTAWIDGRLATGASNGSALVPATATTRVRLFSSIGTSPGSFFPGVARHFMAGAGLLSADDLYRLQGWLAWDSGCASLLPDSHPYKAARP